MRLNIRGNAFIPGHHHAPVRNKDISSAIQKQVLSSTGPYDIRYDIMPL
jgi:hypothetical protein